MGFLASVPNICQIKSVTFSFYTHRHMTAQQCQHLLLNKHSHCVWLQILCLDTSHGTLCLLLLLFSFLFLYMPVKTNRERLHGLFQSKMTRCLCQPVIQRDWLEPILGMCIVQLSSICGLSLSFVLIYTSILSV